MVKTTFIATGDSFITRHIAEDGYEDFCKVANIIKEHDVKFTNLETTIVRQQGYPAAVSGGTWAAAEPEYLEDLIDYGFNLFSTANNHSMDYSHGGILATIENIRQRNCICAGTGSTLDEAAAAAYFTTEQGVRIALLGACSTCDPSAIAGNANDAVTGRPGLNPLRFVREYHIKRRQFKKLQKILNQADFFAALNRAFARGFAAPYPKDTLLVGKDFFICRKKPKATSYAAKADMTRMLEQIEQARKQADYVLVSLHAHEYDGVNYRSPADYQKAFAHQCIDAGADGILGHGPHELRGIEIYKGKPIFYSLGNFIFQYETVSYQPADAYEKRGLDRNSTVEELMNLRSKNGSIGLGTDENIWQSVMASFTAENGILTDITLYPITLDMHLPPRKRGCPRLADDDSVLHHLQALSQPFGTKLIIENGIARIRL